MLGGPASSDVQEIDEVNASTRTKVPRGTSNHQVGGRRSVSATRNTTRKTRNPAAPTPDVIHDGVEARTDKRRSSKHLLAVFTTDRFDGTVGLVRESEYTRSARERGSLFRTTGSRGRESAAPSIGWEHEG